MKFLSDNRLLTFFKKGGLWKAAVIFVLGILLISFGAIGSDSADTEGLQHEEELRLTELCRRVKGVGDCYVMVGYKESQSRYSSSTEKRVESVTVLCDGADSPQVRQSLTDLVTSLYGIGSNRVTILRCK